MEPDREKSDIDSGAGPCYHVATGEGGRGFCVFLHHTTEQDHFRPFCPRPHAPSPVLCRRAGGPFRVCVVPNRATEGDA